MQKKHKFYVISFIFLSTGCAFLSCCFPGSNLALRLQTWETKRHLKSAQAYYENMINTLPRAGDQLLINTIPRLEIPDKYPHCIIGTDYFVYGSSSSYQEVVEYFNDELMTLGWEQLVSSSDHEAISFVNHRPVYTMSVVITQFSDEILLAMPELSSLAAARQHWETRYRTVYVLWFTYADPEIGCWF